MASGFFGFGPWHEHPHTTPFQSPHPKPQPKSVSIPVHFVDSETQLPLKKPALSLTAAAVKVQAAVRGFLARKMLRRVRAVEKEAGEIAEKVAAEKAVISADERERMMVGEMLMRLLLRLDAVRGVREYRRKVIKKVMALQDAVDAMAAVSMGEAPETEERSAVTDVSLAGMEVDGGRAEVQAVLMDEESDHAAAEKEMADKTDAPTTAKGQAMDNKKLMETVAALCESNAQQRALIGELMERVSVLERAVRKMEQRKRKQKMAKDGHGGH